jgi:hypothetical protein
MTQNPRIKRRIERIQGDILIIEEWLKGNKAGIDNYSIGSRSLKYMDPIRLLQLKNELEDELDTLENPGGRFRRVIPVR